ncbi:MAG TPA: outer membrane lipoprotein carrier protein LolA [Thermoanaerobaculia bacterium]|nr:outer membrane lipoprotein carrier protein LolA [Thermoanaerobaculia bacterium]
MTLLLALALHALPQEAQSALDRARAHYNDGAAHAAAFVQIYAPAGFSTGKRESGTLWIQAPERLRFDYEAPEKKTFTYDAGEGRFYAPEDRQLTVHRLTQDERARLPVVFLTAAEELSREYAIGAETGEAGATLLTLTPRAPRPELAWLKLTVARDGSAPELSFEDSAGNRTVFRFERWRREKARAPSDYKVTGPSGTRLVEN